MKKLSLLLLFLIISFSSLQLSAQDTLTVADGTVTNPCVPFYGLFGDYYNRSQVIFPESLLGSMVGGDIHSLTYYLASGPANPWTSVFDVKLGICTDTMFLGMEFLTVPTQTFYTGTMTVVANQLTINFTTPYPYNGGNLLVEFATQTPGNRSSASFYGITSTGSSLTGGSISGLSNISPVSIPSLNNIPFMPKTTFVYTPSSLSCPKPDTFTVSDISAHEALLTWSSGGNETSWEIYVTETDLFPDSSITPTASVTDISYNLTALNPTTDYHAYIRANCGSEQSNWKGLSFHTLCDSIIALPFVENFDTYGTDNYPECWSKLKNNTILEPCISNICYNGGGSLRLSTNESGAYHIAITPTIAQYIPVNILQATFKFRGFYSTDRLIVGVISDPSDATTFVPIDTVYPGTPASTWVERTVIFSSYTGIGQYIAFKNEYTTTNTTTTFIDNLTIDLAPNCPRPQYVTLNNITADGCDVSWTPMGSENTWEIVAVPAGAAVGSGTPVTASSNPFTLTNLLDETQYDVYVRANCGGTYSDWSLSVTFTTNPLCTSALNVNLSQVAGASALVTWDDALYGATSYKVGYSEIGQNSWTAQSVTGNHFLLSGLVPMTAYDVMVLSECPLGNADTVFVQFSTICLAGGNVQIGNDNVAHQGIPINCYWPYSMTEQIFLATEMSGPATIDSIAFEYVSEYPSTGKDSVNIYLGHTTQSSFTNSDDYVSDSILQLVYTGHLNCQHGWNTFPFDVPFHYNGTDNLVLVVDDNSGDTSWVIRKFSVHDAGGYRTVYYYTDNETDNPEPSNPLNGNPIDYFCRERNNVRFFIPCDSTLSCIAPNAYLSYVGKDSLTITWAPGNMESSWEMQYCTDTANWVSLGLVTSPYTIDNLTFDTKYTVRLRAVCGNGEFSDWTTLEVRTPCSYISVPYYEDFEEAPEFGSGNMISCWTTGSIYSGYSSHLFNISHSGSFSVSFNNHAYLATPPFTSETDMQHLRIRFWAIGPDWGYATIPYCIQVGVMTDPDDPTTFVQVAQTYPSTPYTWEMLEVTTCSYTGDGQYIAFRTPQYTIGADIYIDDISIDGICPQVLNITIDTASLTSNSANLTWTAGGDETEWEVVYGLADSIINPDLESLTTVTDTPAVSLSGLLPGSTYNLFVRAICSSNDFGAWVQNTFNTVPVVFYETACENFEWNGTTYTTSGDYTYSHTDANGSTQVDTLHLTIIHGTDSILTVTACDSFYWHGVTYYESNDSATFDTITVAGCDSTVKLHLTVNYSLKELVEATVCDSYEWNGQTYTTSGNYEQTFIAVNGCDSVVTLALTVNPSVTELVEATTDDSCYTWNSETYCSSGDYTQTFQTIYGCDSTVTLHLTITVDVEDHDFASSLIVYPNPTTDIVNVQCAMRNEWVEALEIQLFDAFGRLLDVVEAPLTSSQQTAQINLSHLVKGVYFMKAMADGKVRTVRKVVKQ